MQDAACLARKRLVGDKLFLYQQKTGLVYCPLPPSVVEKLNAVENENERFFFYDGTSQPQSMVKSWDRIFQKVFATAKPAIKGGHPHRFRDTFAVSLLLKGVSIEIVSKCSVTVRSRSPNAIIRHGSKPARTSSKPRCGGSGAFRTPRVADGPTAGPEF
jgi:hypothetical protein